MKKHMKGAMEAVSVVLVTGVLISVVGSVYFWGLPLIEKNKDMSILESSEYFIISLNNEIKNIANNGGKIIKKITVPGIVKFDGENIILEVETKGTIYSTGAEIPLGKNLCNTPSGDWGKQNPDVLCVKSESSGSRFLTTYNIKYIELNSYDKNYKIELDGYPQSGGAEHTLIVENKGSNEVLKNGKTLIKTYIEISIL